MLFVAMCNIVLHGVVTYSFILLVFLRFPIIYIVLNFIILILIIFSILVNLLLCSFLKCFCLLILESAEHADDLLNYLEHVANHCRRQLSCVQCRG